MFECYHLCVLIYGDKKNIFSYMLGFQMLNIICHLNHTILCFGYTNPRQEMLVIILFFFTYKKNYESNFLFRTPSIESLYSKIFVSL